MKKRLLVVGCTGSVGQSALSVCASHPERFEVAVLGANVSVDAMERLGRLFTRSELILADSHAAAELARRMEGQAPVGSGIKAIEEAAAHPDIDHVVIASSGTAAIPVLMAALRNGKEVSLANKESIVVGGPWVLPLIQHKDQLRPLDSEHNAIWQCMTGRDWKDVEKIYLTASGGPFRNFTEEELDRVTPAMATAHPVWDMGKKISVDSATLMNKGIEILEAMRLFSLPSERVQAVISPDPFVHGIVRFRDGTHLLAASSADMRIPCASALFHPSLPPTPAAPPREIAGTTMSFGKPDERRFPCLRIARQAAEEGGAAPALLVGADEVAVEAFLAGAIGFNQIPKVVESVLERYSGESPGTLEDALEIFREGRRSAAQICSTIGKDTFQGDRWS